MLYPANSQRRSQSSTRIELARDLHDSIAQDLVAIGYQLDLLISELPEPNRDSARKIRFEVTSSTAKVRRELYALRSYQSDFSKEVADLAAPLALSIQGDPAQLNRERRKIVDELVRNAATYSKGHSIAIAIRPDLITVQDDGYGFYGVAQMVTELGGSISITTNQNGTRVEIKL